MHNSFLAIYSLFESCDLGEFNCFFKISGRVGITGKYGIWRKIRGIQIKYAQGGLKSNAISLQQNIPFTLHYANFLLRRAKMIFVEAKL
jgi:hypothetical protein